MAKAKKRRRGKRRENRHERRQEQHAGGGEWDAIRIPEGIDAFKPEAKRTYHIDVLPYIVGKLNKNADEGDEYFELSYPVYNNLGIDEKRFIAIGELQGVRDPVAEHFAHLRKAGAEWEDMKDFKPKWRQLFLVFVHEEAEKGLQLYEAAYGTFGELLDEEIAAEEEDCVDNFDDPDHGATLVVRFKAKSIGMANPWVKAAKLTFDEREDGFDADGDPKLAAEILDQVEGLCLDDCLKVTDYDTLKAALDGEPVVGSADDEEEGEPEPEPKKGRRTRKAKPKPEEEPDDEEEAAPKKKSKAKRKAPTATDLGITKGGDVEHDEYGTCTVLRIAKDGFAVVIMDENDDVHKGVDPTDLEPIKEAADPPEDDEDDDGPGGGTSAGSAGKKSQSSKASGAASSAKEPSPSEGDDEDDDWDDDWDEED